MKPQRWKRLHSPISFKVRLWCATDHTNYDTNLNFMTRIFTHSTKAGMDGKKPLFCKWFKEDVKSWWLVMLKILLEDSFKSFLNEVELSPQLLIDCPAFARTKV